MHKYNYIGNKLLLLVNLKSNGSYIYTKQTNI